MSAFEHKVDASIAAKFALHQAVSSNIRVFHVADFGIELDDFLGALSPSYLALPYDYYDVGFRIETYVQEEYPVLYKKAEAAWLAVWHTISKVGNPHDKIWQFWSQYSEIDKEALRANLIAPFRRRSCFQYLVEPTEAEYEWNVTEEGVPIFGQNVDDARARERRFSAPPLSVYRNGIVHKLMAVLAQLLVQNPAVTTTRFKFTLHQMLTYAHGVGANEPAPEGIHQDGADFIVSAIVVDRVNINGGVSTVFYSNNRELPPEMQVALNHELQPGEGIFQADEFHNLWHDISPVFPIQEGELAYRSMLGFDIQFL